MQHITTATATAHGVPPALRTTTVHSSDSSDGAASRARDLLGQIVEETLFRMHLDYVQPQPSDDYLAAMTSSWTAHLRSAGVPWDEVPRIYDRAIRDKSTGRSRGFMPTVDDLLHAWDGVIESGYWEQQNAPEPTDFLALPPGESPLPGGINTDQAPAFVRAFATILKRGCNVRCKCKGDRWGAPPALLVEEGGVCVWCCASDRCDFRQWADETPASSASADAELAGAPGSDDELLGELWERCRLDMRKCGQDQALTFGRYLIERVPVAKWTPSTACAEWQAWQQEVTRAAHA